MLVYQDGERDREVSLGGGVRFGECRRHEGAILAPVGCLVGAEQLFSEADGVRQQVSSQGGPPIGTPAPSVRTERLAPFWLYRWDWGRSSLPPEGPWSWPRRKRGSSSRRPLLRRTPRGPAARSPQRPTASASARRKPIDHPSRSR